MKPQLSCNSVPAATALCASGRAQDATGIEHFIVRKLAQ